MAILIMNKLFSNLCLRRKFVFPFLVLKRYLILACYISFCVFLISILINNQQSVILLRQRHGRFAAQCVTRRGTSRLTTICTFVLRRPALNGAGAQMRSYESSIRHDSFAVLPIVFQRKTGAPCARLCRM